MQLINVNIYNFGKLCNFKYDFSKGLNVILENNGFGKTTLAVFIKTMFYGLENSSKKVLANDERKLYLPWNGGKMGGTLTFSYLDKEYRIERIFNDTIAKDKFTLFNNKTNLVSHDFSSKIGEEIFKIDSVSFEKTFYFTQDFIDLPYPEDIKTRLEYLLEVSDGSVSFEEASRILNDKYKKYTSNKGIINDLNNTINQNKDDLNKIKDAEELCVIKKSQLLDLNNNLNKVRLDINSLQKKISESSQVQAKMEVKKYYYSLKDEINELNKRIDLINGQVISLEDIDSLKDNLKSYQKFIIELDSLNSSIVSLMDSFKKNYGNIVNDYPHCLSLFDSLRDDVEKYYSLVNEINSLTIDESFDDFFIEEFDESNFDELSNCVKLANEKLNKGANQKSNKVLYWCLGFIGLGLIGGSFFFLDKILIMVLMIVFGLLCFMGIGFIRLFKMNKGTFKLNEFNKDLNLIKKYLKAYQISSDEVNEFTFNSVYQEVASKVNEYKNKVKVNKEILDKRNSCLLESEKLNNELHNIFEKYNVYDDNYRMAIINFEKECQKYSDYLKIEDEYKHNYNLLNQRIEDVKSIMESIINKYLINKYNVSNMDYDEAYRTLFDTLQKYKGYLTEIEEKKKKLDDFVFEKGINDKYFDFEMIDVNKINSDLKDLMNRNNQIMQEKTKLEQEIDDLLLVIEMKDLYLKGYNEAVEKKEFIEKDAFLISKTRDILNDAKETLSINYLSPMKNDFMRYLSLIDKSISDVRFNTDLIINLEESSGFKELEYYSRGYKDLVDFCIRFALIKNLYKNELPFIILDDPFVNLDEDKLIKVRNLLSELVKEYQIIYFVCHKSRGCIND